MTAYLLPSAELQFLDANGNPYAGGLLYTYIPATTTPKQTWTNSAQSVLNTNPIVLDAAGRCIVWGSGSYRTILKDSLGNTIFDQITADTITDLIGATIPGALTITGAFTAASLTTSGTISGLVTATGAITPRSLANHFQDLPSIYDFGVVADGGTDDTATLQAALNSLPATGGSICVPNRARIRILSNLTIPANCSLVGTQPLRAPGGSNSNEPFNTWGQTIILSSAATITLNSGAGLVGLIVYRDGITAPVTNPLTFLGTAITGGGDDAYVMGCCIFGFLYGFSSTGNSRLRLYDLYVDCTNGILINNSLDTSRVRNIQLWPFTTIAYSAAGGPASCLQRSGSGITFSGNNDNTVVDDILCFGFQTGISISGIADMIIDKVWIDAATVLAGSYGILITGASPHLLIGEVKTFLVARSVSVQMSTGGFMEIDRIECSGTTDYGIFCNGGVVVLRTISYLSSSGPAIWTVSTIDEFRADVLRLRLFSSGCFESTGTFAPGAMHWPQIITDDGALSYLGNPFAAGGAGSSTLVTIPSATTINIPYSENNFFVSGVTTITTIAGGWADRRITIVFTGILTVTAGVSTVNTILLNGNVDFTSATGSTLTLFYDGSLWREVGRKA